MVRFTMKDSEPRRGLSPFEWALRPFAKFAEFSGRAPRAEYWWFYFATTIIQVAIGVLDELLRTSDKLSTLYSLVIFVPWLAVTVRRLHDTDRSWRWLLLPLATFVALLAAVIVGFNFETAQKIPVSIIVTGSLAAGAFIVILVLMILPGTHGPNRYGLDPYGSNSLETFA